MQKEKIWDPVSRLWHWIFAVAVVANWYMGQFMTFSNVRWHFYVGISVLALLAFRLVWGVCGPIPVRFKTFMPTPAGIFRYLGGFFKREPSGAPGHNPLGALSVYAILLVVCAQAVTGLFIEADDFFETAPLHGYVPDGVSEFMSGWHHALPTVILILVVMHVIAIFYYLIWKRENLIRPMLDGWKWVRRK